MKATSEICPGIYINLNFDDKIEISKNGSLECVMDDGNNAQVVLHVVDEVKEQDSMEKQGFHIQAEPINATTKNITKYAIFLDKSTFEKLVNPTEEIIYNIRIGHHSNRNSKIGMIEVSYINMRHE